MKYCKRTNGKECQANFVCKLNLRRERGNKNIFSTVFCLYTKENQNKIPPPQKNLSGHKEQHPKEGRQQNEELMNSKPKLQKTQQDSCVNEPQDH